MIEATASLLHGQLQGVVSARSITVPCRLVLRQSARLAVPAASADRRAQ
jgi:hypothetical protein